RYYLGIVLKALQPRKHVPPKSGPQPIRAKTAFGSGARRFSILVTAALQRCARDAPGAIQLGFPANSRPKPVASSARSGIPHRKVQIDTFSHRKNARDYGSFPDSRK